MCDARNEKLKSYWFRCLNEIESWIYPIRDTFEIRAQEPIRLKLSASPLTVFLSEQ